MDETLHAPTGVTIPCRPRRSQSIENNEMTTNRLLARRSCRCQRIVWTITTWLVLLLLVERRWTPPVFGFVVSSLQYGRTALRRPLVNCMDLSSTASDSSNQNLSPSSPRSNPTTARAILETLVSRYGGGGNETLTTEDWRKARNYVYQASSRLSMDQVQDVLDFLEKTFPEEPVLIRSILTTAPRILRKNVSTNLEPTRDFLVGLYGDALFREAISRNPQLLLASGVSHGPPNEKLEAYLAELGMSITAIAKLQKSAPFLFHLDTTKVESVVNYLSGLLERGGYSNGDGDHETSDSKTFAARQKILAKVISAYPHLMSLSVEDNLRPRIHFLQEQCDLTDAQVASLIKSSSGILGLSVTENLKPTLEFLSNMLRYANMTDDDTVNLLRRCIMGHPQLLALSLENLQNKVDYFNAIESSAFLQQVDEAAGTMTLAGRIAVRAPAVYSLSLKANIVPKVEFLAKVWGTPYPPGGDADASDSISDRDLSLSVMIGEYPSVLTLSLEGNIQPTVSFFNRTGYISLDSDWNEVGTSTVRKGDALPSPRIRGRYIAASLFNRLLPRWHQLVANGWTDKQENPVRLSLPPLHLLVAATDRAFCEHFDFDYQDYKRFKDESVPRLKFSSQFDTWLKTGRPIDETV